MSPIVLRHEKVIVILMKGKTDYRSLEIEDLIERGLGSGDSLGKRFHARTYSLEGFFSSHYARTQRSGLTGNWLIAKVLRRMLGFRWWGIVSSNSSTRKSISSAILISAWPKNTQIADIK
ncbi:MAG: hypothetical protein QF614_00265 [SAR324 cluster bacterium]|nr:hypothetical protein [SAR324 cluster bacterium]